MCPVGSCLTPALSFPCSHFRSIDPGLKEDALEFLIKGVYGGGEVGDRRCLFACLFTTFYQPHDDIKAVVIQLVWLSPGTFDLLRSVILVDNTELCVFAVRADQQEILPAFELPLFHRDDSSVAKKKLR